MTEAQKQREKDGKFQRVVAPLFNKIDLSLGPKKKLISHQINSPNGRADDFTQSHKINNPISIYIYIIYTTNHQQNK